MIRVLLVDDDPRLLASLGRRLDDAGFQVETAVSAEETTAILRAMKFDAMVCDNQMVGASGTKLLSTVSRSYPHMARFMLTGDISRTQEYLIENEIGADGLFYKPCNADVIASAITECVQGRKSDKAKKKCLMRRAGTRTKLTTA